MMYLRMAGLVTIFNRSLITILGVPFLVLAGASIACGWLWSRIPDATAGDVEREFEPKNPLELRAALGFAVALRRHAGGHAPGGDLPGQGGRLLAGGPDGRDGRGPVHHGNDAVRRQHASLGVAAAAILIAASSNNLVKGIYAYSLSDRKTGVLSLSLLAALAVAGLAPLLWLAR